MDVCIEQAKQLVRLPSSEQVHRIRFGGINYIETPERLLIDFPLVSIHKGPEMKPAFRVPQMQHLRGRLHIVRLVLQQVRGEKLGEHSTDKVKTQNDQAPGESQPIPSESPPHKLPVALSASLPIVCGVRAVFGMQWFGCAQDT
jgi:hypothetical protein